MSVSAHVPAPSSDRDRLLKRLHEIVIELVEHHRSLALLLAAEKEGRVAAWHEAQPIDGKDSVSWRDRISDFNITPLSTDIIKLKGEIAALIEERNYIQLLLGEQG